MMMMQSLVYKEFDEVREFFLDCNETKIFKCNAFQNIKFDSDSSSFSKATK